MRPAPSRSNSRHARSKRIAVTPDQRLAQGVSDLIARYSQAGLEADMQNTHRSYRTAAAGECVAYGTLAERLTKLENPSSLEDLRSFATHLRAEAARDDARPKSARSPRWRAYARVWREAADALDLLVKQIATSVTVVRKGPALEASGSFASERSNARDPNGTSPPGNEPPMLTPDPSTSPSQNITRHPDGSTVVLCFANAGREYEVTFAPNGDIALVRNVSRRWNRRWNDRYRVVYSRSRHGDRMSITASCAGRAALATLHAAPR